jgi:DNA repair protein RadA/Sms
MAKTQKVIFICSECGNESAKWHGKCPACGAWNSLEEHLQQEKQEKKRVRSSTGLMPVAIGDINENEQERILCGIGELDRVMGGGMVKGSLVLIGGDPGIGKSTLLLQACANLAEKYKVMYVSAEESALQIKLRAKRLGVGGGESGKRLYILAETDMEEILAQRENLQPDFLVIDSVQTVYKPGLTSMPGSVSQVRQCAGDIMHMAKGTGCTCFLVGHVTKEGALAGPRVLEHMVDAVLYFEGDRRQEYRVLRAAKNRFGSVNEIGVFRMGEKGMEQVENPSEFFLSGRSKGESGSVVTCALEGSRPVLVDMQALVSQTVFPAPRRQSYGFDSGRLALLLAVLEKRANMKLYNMDVYANVAGGIEIDEPAADLPLVAAVASSLSGMAIDPGVAVMGEVGLSGEVRAVNQMDRRVAECARMGFKFCIIPRANLKQLGQVSGIKVMGVGNVREAMDAIFAAKGE